MTERIKNALRFQSLTHSDLKEVAGVSDEDIAQALGEGAIEAVGMTTEFRDLLPGEADEVNYV